MDLFIDPVDRTKIIIDTFHAAREVMNITHDIPLDFINLQPHVFGSYNHNTHRIYININALHRHKKDFLIFATVHELQHAKQSRDGRLVWNSENEIFTWEDSYSINGNDLQELSKKPVHDAYLRLPWELDANTVANELSFSIAESIGYLGYDSIYNQLNEV